MHVAARVRTWRVARLECILTFLYASDNIRYKIEQFVSCIRLQHPTSFTPLHMLHTVAQHGGSEEQYRGIEKDGRDLKPL